MKVNHNMSIIIMAFVIMIVQKKLIQKKMNIYVLMQNLIGYYLDLKDKI